MTWSGVKCYKEIKGWCDGESAGRSTSLLRKDISWEKELACTSLRDVDVGGPRKRTIKCRDWTWRVWEQAKVTEAGTVMGRCRTSQSQDRSRSERTLWFFRRFYSKYNEQAISKEQKMLNNTKALRLRARGRPRKSDSVPRQLATPISHMQSLTLGKPPSGLEDRKQSYLLCPPPSA